jgi:hypothetical protein
VNNIQVRTYIDQVGFCLEKYVKYKDEESYEYEMNHWILFVVCF